MDKTEIIFKPQYHGRAVYNLYLIWPLSAIGTVYFAIETVRTGNYYAYGLIVLILALLVLSMPFMYCSAVCFGEALVIKRFFLPKQVIQYNEIISFHSFSLRPASTQSISMQTTKGHVLFRDLSIESYKELNKILNQFVSRGLIKKKPERH